MKSRPEAVVLRLSPAGGICIWSCTCTCACTCMWTCACICMCMYVHVHVHVHVCVCPCVCVCIVEGSVGSEAIKSCKSHKVQSSHASHTRCSRVKSCESARVSAETVICGSVVAVVVDGKDGIVAGKDGYAKRCRGLNFVRIVSPQIDSRGSALSLFRCQPVDRDCSASALSGVVVPGVVMSASAACRCRWYVLRRVVCRSCAAPVGVVAVVLVGLGEGRWEQRRAADVLLDAHVPAVDLDVACLGSPRRRARPRA